jgi:septum formation protein
VIQTSAPIVLASRSETRATLLRNAGLAVRIVPSGVDEDPIKANGAKTGASAEAVALALAEAKAVAVAQLPEAHDAWVIAADQMLDCEGRWFDQPAGRAGARDQLAALSGRTHRLISAAVIARNRAVVWRGSDSATLRMRALDATDIDRYLDAAGDDVLGSVGAYRLEGLGVHLFAGIAGDYFTILGLPLLAVLDQLRRLGAIRGPA